LKEIEKLRKKLILQEKKNIMEIERLTEKIKEQEGEILNYKNKISQLEKEKEMLEERIEKIGLEFEKRMNKIIENALKQLDIEKKKQINELKNQFVSIALLAASKVIEKNLNTEENRKIVENIFDEAGVA